MLNILNKKIIMPSAKIFGENYTVEVVYKKISNPELNLCGKIIMVYLPTKYKRTGDTGKQYRIRTACICREHIFTGCYRNFR